MARVQGTPALKHLKIDASPASRESPEPDFPTEGDLRSLLTRSKCTGKWESLD
ncbi:mCG124516 [Mus musculus]|nr:mCG124516 [Mus musculus]